MRLSARLLARSQYPEVPATGHLDTGFSWFPCVYKQMLRWFPRLQVATTCYSCSPPDLNFVDPYFIFMYMHYNYCHQTTAHLQLKIIIIIIIIIIIEFFTSQLWLGNIHLSWDVVINRIGLDGLTCNLKSFLQCSMLKFAILYSFTESRWLIWGGVLKHVFSI